MKLHNPPFRFVRKKYGRGRTPVTRQGWVSMVVFTVLIVILSFLPVWLHWSESVSLLFIFLAPVLPIVLLLFVCYYKGEKPKRQRGEEQ